MGKRYYNPNTKGWYTEGQSMTRRIDNGVFSGIPSVELLTEWGFVEYIEPEPTPAELLERAKASKIAELEAYDDSDAVNIFDVVTGGHTITAWLTPEQRANYKNSLDSAELLGMDKVHPVLNGVTLELSVNDAKLYLAQIQIYADKCYGVTEQHKANVMALTTIEEVEAYDLNRFFPEKLTFDVTELMLRKGGI